MGLATKAIRSNFGVAGLIAGLVVGVLTPRYRGAGGGRVRSQAQGDQHGARGLRLYDLDEEFKHLVPVQSLTAACSIAFDMRVRHFFLASIRFAAARRDCSVRSRR